MILCWTRALSQMVLPRRFHKKTKTAAARVNTGDEDGDKNVMSSILYHTKRVNIIITIKTEIGEASQ